MERAVEIFVFINFAIIAISHLLQANAWVEFFKVLRNHGRAGAMANGFLSLSFGSIIVSFHWVWEGVMPTVITCIGIAQLIKSVIAFVAPEQSLKMMHRPMAEKPWGYQIGGALFLVFTGALAYHLWG